METIVIRELPVTDLNIGFAIVQKDGTVKQYYASYDFLLSQTNDESVIEYARQLMVNQIKNENPDAEVVLEKNEMTGSLIDRAKLLPLTKFTNKTINQMTKNQIKGTLYQFNYDLDQKTPKLVKILWNNTVSLAYKGIASLYNMAVRGVFRLIKPEIFEFNENMSRFDYLDEMDKLNAMLLNPDKLLLGQTVRRVEPMQYLSIIAGEENLQLAIIQLALDLDRLAQDDLIIASMGMPSVVDVANTVGNGKKIYAIFAMVVIDSQKMFDKMGTKWQMLTASDFRAILSTRYGIKTLTDEGGVTYFNDTPPYENLVVSREPIKIQAQNRQEQKDELTRLYEQQVEDTKRAQQKMRERRLTSVQDPKNDGK